MFDFYFAVFVVVGDGWSLESAQLRPDELNCP